MLRNRNLLPPLDYLLAFEAAASQQSFAAAARDMNVSETAVSRKIKLLELHYGISLFDRRHRSVILTRDGHLLLEAILPALEALVAASSQIISVENRPPVTLAATNSVASLWLVPRLSKFNKSKKRVRINLVASDSDEECLADAVDLAILRGDGGWPNFESKLLFGETIFPVCTPGFLRGNPSVQALSGLAQTTLLEVTNVHTEWMNWRTWLTELGYDGAEPAQRIHFNTYPLAIQAAVDGLGVALGWGHLVDRYLESGQLVRLMPTRFAQTAHGYYLLTRQGSAPSPEQDTVRNWLIKESDNRKRYGAAPA